MHIICLTSSSLFAVCVVIIDYALSQSTLEQVFLKQIRPSGADEVHITSITSNVGKEPKFLDYFNGYMIWTLAFFIPGLHQFYLGDTARGFKYFFTINECLVGWMLDLFEMHVLVQKRVETYGNAKALCCFSCCESVDHAPVMVQKGPSVSAGSEMQKTPSNSATGSLASQAALSSSLLDNEHKPNPMARDIDF
jgi:TM2 domain-containing membrane protein YozV